MENQEIANEPPVKKKSLLKIKRLSLLLNRCMNKFVLCAG